MVKIVGGKMPASYRIDKARHLILSVATGTCIDDDLLDHKRSLSADPEFDPGFRQLFDFRKVTTAELTTACVRQLVRDNPFEKGARRAVVCDIDLLFGLARMFEMLNGDGPDEVRVFREMSDALAWLRIDTID